MSRLRLPLWVFLSAFLGVTGCDRLLTELPTSGDDFESPFPDLPSEWNAMFNQGDENFGKAFTVADGLGPIFNQASCAGCHPGDGRGTPAQALIRFSRGTDLLFSLGGPQLQDRAIPGIRPEDLPPGVESSKRLPPPVFGMGLIEAIPVEMILSYADPDDGDGDGISGRPNWVSAPDYVPITQVGGGSGLQLGRFGRKASVSSLIQQVSQAYHQDIGITSDFIPVENPHPQVGGVAIGDPVPDPEISAATVMQTAVYVRLLAPPRRGPITPEVQRGGTLFQNIGCASCHVPTMRTGPHLISQLSNVDANIYSDLLLHDMGPNLADNRPDGSADGREWRTAPLWGARLAMNFLDGTAYYLHDGRTTDLAEAIEIHGGEAQKSRDAFVALSEADRKAVLVFLLSL